VTHSRCGSGARWCARADAIFDVAGMHVLDVGNDADGRLILTVESDQVQTGCPSCGVVAASHGRRPRMLHDAPCLGQGHDGAVAETDVALLGAGVPGRGVQRIP
jgi:transposase